MQNSLLKPRIIDVEALGAGHAKVVMEPFERGYGHTLGNALRRVLLSSMVGYAPTEVTIAGVVHEYSSLDGVQEDVVDLLLNLKGVVFKVHNRDAVTLTLKKEGEGAILASDIDLPHDVELINPDHVIAHLTAGGKLDMQIKVEKGRGYVPGNVRRLSEDTNKTIGRIILDAAHWRERRVQDDAADGLVGIFRQAADVTRHVAAALLDLDLHVQLATGGQVGNHVVRVDQLDVVRQVDVRCQDGAFAFLLQGQGDCIAVVDLEDHALEVQQQVDDVFLHTVQRRVLVHDAGDRHFGGRVADHRRQQDAAQRVTQGVTIATLERLHHDFGVTGAQGFDVDDTWLQQTVLHVMSFSIPSARYTDKAEWL